MATISIRNVFKAYGTNAVVHGISAEIESGAFVVILGPSGCGKSTLLRMIAGLEGITKGEIAISERVVNDLEPRERGCAMVFQNYALYPHMSVSENIGYALKVAGVAKAERQKRIAAVAEIVGLGDYLDRKPAALSGGQRQRVAMARAIIREPEVFLFDEPLSNLDAKLRVHMRAEIRKLHRRLGATSVFVTHDQVEAMTLADQLIVMNAGKIEQIGTPAEVYHRPASRFVANFVGAPPMNLLDGTVDEAGWFTLADGNRVDLGSLRTNPGPVTLGVRPEEVRMVAPDTVGALPLTVDFIEELGASRVVYADLGGISFAITGGDTGHLTHGQPRAVLIDPAAVHLFDPESGMRL